MQTRYIITIDPIYKTPNYSVQIDDTSNYTTKILDDAYINTVAAFQAAQEYINKIGARR
ncbi:MAG: hypothetical protein H8E12_07700 [Rhodobacteraceae bacterium]|nr:hypothetical protein [Paracoccaceae bacterium]